jgi:hypothetical protein
MVRPDLDTGTDQRDAKVWSENLKEKKNKLEDLGVDGRIGSLG